MRTGLPALALVGGAASFGASGLSLALLGLGLPFVLASLLAAGCAGLVIYAAGRWTLARISVAPGNEQRVHELEQTSADLRHELRGVLSPAMMVSDRLLKSDDPAIQRAGQAVVRSIERATELIVQNKKDIVGDAAAPWAPSGPHPGESGAPPP